MHINASLLYLGNYGFLILLEIIDSVDSLGRSSEINSEDNLKRVDEKTILNRVDHTGPDTLFWETGQN